MHVAIADVGLLRAARPPLDREARIRGNSVYFPDRVVPMLPERISNDLCSLREGEERACLVARMVSTSTGTRRGHTLLRAMMRSAAKLSYAGGAGRHRRPARRQRSRCWRRCSKPLWAAYAALAAARDRREPLDLDLPERKILLDTTGTVERVHRPAAAGRASPDRGVHDPGQRRGRRDAGSASARR